MTVVYLSNQTIQVLVGEEKGGKIFLSKAYEVEVPEECLINGVITDEKLLGDYLGTFWAQNHLARKGVRLVINSSQFVIKAIDLPKMKPDQVLDVLEQEFSDVENKQDPLYGYRKLSSGKSNFRVFATMAERSFVGRFFALFEGLGIEVISANTAHGCLVRLLEHMPRMSNRTCIVQIVEDNNLLSVLWVDGVYQYASRARLFSESGTESLGAEISRTVNNLLQFYASLKRDESLQDVFIGGLDKVDLPYYRQGMESLNMQVGSLDTEGLVQHGALPQGKGAADYAMLLGSFLSEKGDRNLIAAYRVKPGAEKERRAMIGRLLPIGIVTGICIVATLAMTGYSALKQAESDRLFAYVSDPQNMAAMQENSLVVVQKSALQRRTTAAKDLLSALGTYPAANSAVMQAIATAGKGTVITVLQSYDASKGALTLGAVASKPEAINGFINKLMKLEEFDDIQYSGYAYDEKTALYDIDVTCYLAATVQP